MTACIDHGRNGDKNGYTTQEWNGKEYRKHRVVYCKAYNVTMESIDGLVVRHTCDNTRCINAKHLLLGTHADNSQDKVERRRHPPTIPKLTPEQVLYCRRVYVFRDRDFGQVALGRKFGVPKGLIHKAIHGDTYGNVTSTSIRI